jgi:hypothetical protein
MQQEKSTVIDPDSPEVITKGKKDPLAGVWQKAFAVKAFAYGAYHFYTAYAGPVHPIV